jgi:DNA polymerase-3 subunit delta
MQLTIKQLPTQLTKSLSPLYLISGDEPLLIQDARDMIVAQAKKNGFTEKQLLHVDTGFQAETLSLAIEHRDLFSDKKIIDIRNAAAKFDNTLQAAFEQISSS